MDYSAEVRRRFLAPARAGVISSDTGNVIEGSAEDRSLNLWVRFQAEVQAGTLSRVRFQAYGCPHSIAAADLLAADLEGSPVAALTDIDVETLAAELQLPREKIGNLLRIEDAFTACHKQAGSKERE
jgi:NifU-like protein